MKAWGATTPEPIPQSIWSFSFGFPFLDASGLGWVLSGYCPVCYLRPLLGPYFLVNASVQYKKALRMRCSSPELQSLLFMRKEPEPQVQQMISYSTWHFMFNIVQYNTKKYSHAKCTPLLMLLVGPKMLFHLGRYFLLNNRKLSKDM